MARTIQIGSRTFEIPDAGENAGWGEDTTEFLVAVADALESVQGPNDILLTAASLANNQTSSAIIPGLSINLIGNVKAAEVDYVIERTFNSGATTITENGKILSSYDGTQFKISIEAEGDTGISIDADNTGQFTYTSSNLADHVSSVIRFKVSTIDS